MQRILTFIFLIVIIFWKCLTKDETRKPVEDKGFLRSRLEAFFRKLYCFFPTRYFGNIFPNKAYSAIEIYVLVWFIVEILILIIIANVSFSPDFFSYLIIALLGYRLLDIFRVWVHHFILSYDWDPIDPNRTLIIVFISYAETMLIYASIAFLSQESSVG